MRKLQADILEDYLRHTYRVQDQAILNAVKRALSAREQKIFELHATVVTGKKLVVICRHPERIKEVILITKECPRKIYRKRLTLDRKQNASEA